MNRQLSLFNEDESFVPVSLADCVDKIIADISSMDRDSAIDAINSIRQRIHDASPFKDEPVDLVLWVKSESVQANDYNPNSVAPPEMELLEVSIMNDGYTQPIVTWPRDEIREVVDGFHRSRVGKESVVVSKRVAGYLPVVTIRKEQQSKNDRIASTIRHNRARGKHQVDAMSEIVLELKNRNWTNQRIARELGMDEDEILRLCQITGLGHLFTDKDFSRAWESIDAIDTDDFMPLDDKPQDGDVGVRTINTDDPNRVFHTFDKWECVKAGFYASTKDGWSKDQCEQAYLELLSDTEGFESVSRRVLSEWPMSCEHYLTNSAMNRLAWIGQASVCLKHGVPSQFSSGWNLLSDDQKNRANEVALKVLNEWLQSREVGLLDFEQAAAIGRQVEIY
jgi:ParB-like chromosome segregation protein Spo0J